MKRDDDLGGLRSVTDPRTLLEGLFAHAPMAFQIFDATGRSVAVNPAFVSLFGTVPPPGYNPLRDEQAAKSGQLHLAERAFAGEVIRTEPIWYDPRKVEHVTVKEGRRCAIACTAFPLFDRDGKVEHVVLAFRDVTAELEAREQAEAERDRLREVLATSGRTQAQLQAIVDYGPAAIYLKDLDGRHLMANREIERVMNQPQAFFVGRTDHEIFPAAQADVMRANDLRVIAGRAPISCEEVVQLPDGPHTFLSVKFPVLDASGAPIALGGMSVDITDRILAVERLRQSEERFAKYFAASPLPASISVEGRVIEVNPACERFAGRSRAELIGRTGAEIGMMLDPADRAALRERLQRDGFARDFEGVVQTASGRRRHVLISVERMELEGRPCLLTLIHDLTERVQLEEQLRHSQKMEAIGRLAGGIAHDFNNLLTALSGYNALLLEGLRAEDPLRAYAVRVSQAAARASALTRQLLAFSRKQPSAPVELDLNALTGGTINMLRPLIGEDIEVSCAFDPALGAVRADPTQLEQVIANLVINARDAMPRGGRLAIETANLDEDGAWVRLTVRDTGTGIDPTARARLFEPFFTTKEPGKGTGLGLALVYGIVDQSGGRVLVDSEPGHGAAFEVRLPRLPAQHLSEPAEKSGPVLLPQGHETILLVEDDESVRELVRFVLAQKGYRVLEAEDGRDALAQAAAFPGTIDLLISDVVMPHLDGSELAARLRETRPETRVLHISGYPGDTVERHGPLGPPNAFLPKPFSREALLARVRAILDEKRRAGA